MLLAAALLLSACDQSRKAAVPVKSSSSSTVPGAVPAATPDLALPDLPEYRLIIDTAGYDALSPESEYMLDGLLYVALQDFPKQNDTMYTEDTLLVRMKELMGDDVRIVTLTLSKEHSARLSYPAWLIVYETGRNGEAMLCTDVYFQTDTDEYRAHTRVPADYAQDYRDRTETLLASLALVSKEEEAAFAKIDTVIHETISIINAVRQDELSRITFDFEKRLVYDILSTQDKALYCEVASKVREFEPFIYRADKYGYDVLDGVMRACSAIAIDWPHLENYFILEEEIEGTATVALKSRYFMPWDALQKFADMQALREETARFDAICERIIDRMPKGLSAYDKYRYLATVISLATNYDYDCVGGWQTRTAYGAVLGGFSICQGYARGFMALCEKANLWCVCVEGVVDGSAHMWNMVRLDSGVYHVDVTWADGEAACDSPEWLAYFMRTKEEISVDRTIAGETIDVFEREY